MLYGQQYKHLINHSSHKIKLITNSPNTYVYRVEILTDNKKLFFYEWHVQKEVMIIVTNVGLHQQYLNQ